VVIAALKEMVALVFKPNRVSVVSLDEDIILFLLVEVLALWIGCFFHMRFTGWQVWEFLLCESQFDILLLPDLWQLLFLFLNFWYGLGLFFYYMLLGTRRVNLFDLIILNIVEDRLLELVTEGDRLIGSSLLLLDRFDLSVFLLKLLHF